MRGAVQYLALAAIFAVAASHTNGKNDGVIIKGMPRFPLNGSTITTTNISRVGNGKENEGNNGVHRFQMGNVTTMTNASRSSRSSECTFVWWTYPMYWTSPNFGTGNYPNGACCNIYGWGGPAIGEFTFQPFELQKKKNGKCKDYVSITYPYGVIKKWCGNESYKTVTVPSYNFEATFYSDWKITAPGFNITIDIIYNAECYEFIYLGDVDDTYEFATPNYPNPDWEKDRTCEFIFYTNWGNRLQLDFEGFDLKPPCKKNNVVVNLESEWDYPRNTSIRFCDNTIPPRMTSTWNEVHLVYQANKRNIGFKGIVTVVPGDYWITWTTWPWYTIGTAP